MSFTYLRYTYCAYVELRQTISDINTVFSVFLLYYWSTVNVFTVNTLSAWTSGLWHQFVHIDNVFDPSMSALVYVRCIRSIIR